MKLNISFRKIKAFALKHKVAISIILVVFLSAAGFILNDFLKNNDFNGGGLNLRPKKETKVAAPLTGLMVESSVAEKRPMAVVIENSVEARPQSGYNKADVVYETLAEGGITRTMAIFQSQEASEIGPIRSARPYFIDWLSEVNAIFYHVGGSADAFDYIASTKISNINQFRYGSYFWRSADRYAPHNVYSTTERLRNAAKAAGYETTVANLKWYEFKKDIEEENRPQSQKITIDFSGPLYSTGYLYNSSTNDYTRSVAQTVNKDKVSGEAITVKNIIVQFETVGYGVTRAGEQKVNIGTIGKGNGFFFQDGKAVKITWEKTSRTALTVFKDESGNTIKLNPGRTWIAIPPVGANVTYQ